MLHLILGILLGILKIIGILLLTVLVLLLFVLSAILFGPVRYHIRAAKTEEALEAALTVSWLHLIRARLLVDGRKQTHALDIRIFGISPAKLKEWLGRKKQKKKQKRSSGQSGRGRTAQAGKRQERNSSVSKIQLHKEESTESQKRIEKTLSVSEKNSKNSVEKNESEEEQRRTEQQGALRQDDIRETGEKPAVIQSICDEDSAQKFDSEEVKGHPRKNIAARLLEMIQALPYKIHTFCATIKSNVERIREIGKRLKRMSEGIWRRLQQASEIPEKIRQLLDFVEDYHLKELFAEGKAELNGLWRHYRPRKATGYLQFGTGDPALTGELTGVLYLLLPAFSEVHIEPDFNDPMLQTELELSGHIRACYLVATAWRLFRNKKLRRLIAKIRKKGD